MLINSSARTISLIFSYLSSAGLLGASFVYSRVSLILDLLFVSVGIISVVVSTSRRRLYFFPMLMSIFYVFGFILSRLNSMIDEGVGVGVVINRAIFDLTNEQFIPILLASAAGMVGVFLAMLIFEKFIGESYLPKVVNTGVLNEKYVIKLLQLWLVVSLMVIGIMYKYGIGRTGLIHDVELPFYLSGIMFYMKSIVIPMLFFVVFTSAIRVRNDFAVNLTFLAGAMVGVVGSMAFLSRGFIVVTILPALLYTFAINDHLSWGNQRAKLLLVASFALMLILMPTVNFLREAAFADVNTVNWSSIETDLFGAFVMLVGLFTGRIGGYGELAAVSDFGYFNILTPYRIFLGDEGIIDDLLFNIMGFRQDTYGDKAFGYSFGIFGYLFLSGSYFVVCLGAFLFSSIGLIFEEMCRRFNVSELAAPVSLYIMLTIWFGTDWYTLQRVLLVCFVCIYSFKLLRGKGYI